MTISPPSKVKIARLKPFQTLASGFDTIVLAIDVIWENESFFEYLKIMKELAIQEDKEIAIAVYREETDEPLWMAAIKPHGTKGYEWNVNSIEFSLLIGNWQKPKQKPSIMAHISSEAIWTSGPEKIVNFLLNILTHAGASIEKLKASRVDICIDILFPQKQWKMNLIEKRVTRANYAAPHFHNKTLTGISIGKGKIGARLYDKVLEIEQKSKKYWMYDVWGIDSIPEEFRVIRIEFQLRREAIKDLGFDFIFDVLNHCDNMWAYCTQKWLKFQTNPGKHHTQRQTLRWWKKIQNSFLGVQDATPLIRCKAISPKKELLANQAYGAIRSFMALVAEEFDLPIDYHAPLEKTLRYIAGFFKEQDKTDFKFSMDIHDKRAKYSRIAAKMIEADQKRTDLGFPSDLIDNPILRNVRKKQWKNT